MPESPSKIILFDIDGTLLTCRGAGQKGMEAALSETFGLQPPFSSIPCAGRTDCGIFSGLLDTFALPNSEQSRTRFRDSYLRHLPDWLHKREAKLLPGVLPLLNQLRGHSQVLSSILTGNYQEAARIKLDHFEIRDRFEEGIYGDHHEERNRLAEDAVDLFSRKLNRRVAGSSFLIIGDTPADIRCARSIGASVIAVATGVHDQKALSAAEPDVLLSDLSDTHQATNAIVRLLDV